MIERGDAMESHYGALIVPAGHYEEGGNRPYSFKFVGNPDYYGAGEKIAFLLVEEEISCARLDEPLPLKVGSEPEDCPNSTGLEWIARAKLGTTKRTMKADAFKNGTDCVARMILTSAKPNTGSLSVGSFVGAPGVAYKWEHGSMARALADEVRLFIPDINSDYLSITSLDHKELTLKPVRGKVVVSLVNAPFPDILGQRENQVIHVPHHFKAYEKISNGSLSLPANPQQCHPIVNISNPRCPPLYFDGAA